MRMQAAHDATGRTAAGSAAWLAVAARVLVVGLALALAVPAAAQEAVARLDVAKSLLRDVHRGLAMDLYLSQPVPYRVFTLDDPRRLVLDFRDIDWRGVSREGLRNANRATDVRFSALRPGWSRMVVELAGPMVIRAAGMTVQGDGGATRLRVVLDDATPEQHAARAGAPPDPGWDMLSALDGSLPAAPDSDPRVVVVLDPGHGGVDPGAERDGLKEADLMLSLAREIAAAMAQDTTLHPVLTRSADIFVPLDARMTIARTARADVLLSLHADALELDQAAGAAVYTLSQQAADGASERMAERHGQGDLIAGVDLSGQDDTVAHVLMEMARLETAPRSGRLAEALVKGLQASGARLNNRPRREAMLAVLTAADFPSVLIEVGFLSNARDRATLATPEGRAPIVAGIVQALRSWAADEAARAPLMRR
jgi:N-acetylmuramoyl-L-alanine amidase